MSERRAKPASGPGPTPSRIYSIGHSIRPLADFLALLEAHAIERLADIRSKPVSRRHPHFSRPALSTSLASVGIEYRWMPDLGGLRSEGPGAHLHAGWREPGFRAYAEHMRTAEFEAGRAALEEWAIEAPLAFMCAEADYRNCHRQLLADALGLRGWEVLHIVADTPPLRHPRTRFAVVDSQGRLAYPKDPELPLG